MGYLLDTHILLWSFFEPERLSYEVQEILQKNSNCYISSLTLFEISLKYGLGKLHLNELTPEGVFSEIKRLKYNILEIKAVDIIDFHNLPQKIHKDPFDKMLVWQAIKNNLTLISQDKKMEIFKENGLKAIL